MAVNEQFICVLRRPTGLAALVSSRRQEFVRPRPVLEENALPLAGIDPYLEEVRPFGDHELAWADVRASWESLGCVSAFNAQTLFHILHVLICTLPDSQP